ncbi:MAG: pyruvate kinase, partial [Chlamydiia bacterium]|nr:pyruvate kinase [Chlamydiia bacterium]
QMLESMIYNPRPTRAEVSDVANAIYDGTDAVMLSGETAVGKYPTEAVNMMDQVAREAEKDFPHQLLLERHSKLKTTSVPSALTLACAKTSYNLGANSFFVFTSSGLTPRLLSRLRPSIPIVSLTPKEQTYHQMALFWGVIPVLGESFSTYAEAFTSLCKVALERKLVSLGDLVVITSGSTFGLTGTTNTMIVENIGDVLVRGRGVSKKTVYGCVYIVHNPEGVPAYSARDRILVITRCDESYLPIIEEARGVVLQNGIEDQASVDFLPNTLTALDKPGLTHTEEATQILKTGQLVTLDSEKQLIYKSIILSNNRGS